MTNQTGHHPDTPEEGSEPQSYSRPMRTAGLEEGLGLQSGSGGFGFNAIMELAKGSTKAEEWMVRTPWEARMMNVHNLDVAADERCKTGDIDTNRLWWLRGHQMQGLNGKRVQQIVDMVIAQTNRPTARQSSSFEQANGMGAPMMGPGLK